MEKRFNNILKIRNIPQNCIERYLNLEVGEAAAMTSSGIFYSGISFLRRGYQMGRPTPSVSHMVIFTTSGEGYLATSENEYILTEKSLIVVPAEHACMFGVKDDDWKILWFYMNPHIHWNSLIERGISFSYTDLCERIGNSMEAYLSEFGSPGTTPGRAAELHAKLIAIYLDRALGISEISDDQEMKNSLEKLWKSVRDNVEEKWTLEQLSSKLNVSASTFQRLVKKYYSTTAWQKVIEIRMEQARIMLLNTNYPLKVIAEKLGYADEFVFSNAFKRFYGTFPRFYKKQKNSGIPARDS